MSTFMSDSWLPGNGFAVEAERSLEYDRDEDSEVKDRLVASAQVYATLAVAEEIRALRESLTDHTR